MTLSEKLRQFYVKKVGTVDRFRRDIQPFYYFYLTWERRPYYTPRVALNSSQFFNWLVNAQFEYVKKHVDSFRCVVTGEPGTGKSILAIELANRVRDIDGKGGQIHLTYGAEGFVRLFKSKQVSANDVIIADEMPKYEGEGSVKIKNELENIVNSVRATRIHFIFSTPKISSYFAPLAKFQIAGRDAERRETLTLLYLGDHLIGKVVFKIRHLEDYIEFERQKKEAFVKWVMESGGGLTLNMNDVVSVKEAKPLQISSVVVEGSSESFRKFILENAGSDYNEAVTYLKLLMEGYTQLDIAEKFNVPQGIVSRAIRRFGEKRLGYVAEEFFRRLYKDKREFCGRAPQDTPDVIDENGDVYSIKCYLPKYNRSRVRFSKFWEECAPEIKYCMNVGKPYFYFVFSSPLWKNAIIKTKIDMNQIPISLIIEESGRVYTNEGVNTNAIRQLEAEVVSVDKTEANNKIEVNKAEEIASNV